MMLKPQELIQNFKTMDSRQKVKMTLWIVVPILVLLLPILLFEDNVVVIVNIFQPGSFSLLLNHIIIFSVPIFLAALGGLYSERSGVINLALEGMMLAGSFIAVIVAYFTQDLLLSIILGVVVGTLLGLIHAVISIHLKGDQIISGVAINILALGLTNYFFKLMLSEVKPADIPDIPTINDIMNWNAFFGSPPQTYDILKMIGYVLFEQSPLVYLAIGLAFLGHYVLFHTSFGLRVRAVGEHPRAADTLGINVYFTRYACVIISGALAGLAGVYLSLGFTGFFAKNMTAGRGFIAIAAYIFGNWNVAGTAIASLLFGFFTALEEFLKLKEIFLMLPIPFPGIGLREINILAEEFLEMIPYLLTIAILTRSVRKIRPPSAIGKSYDRELK
ncbi:MAG: ABC transporter permease [Promethearchaeota archaeon]